MFFPNSCEICPSGLYLIAGVSRKREELRDAKNQEYWGRQEIEKGRGIKERRKGGGRRGDRKGPRREEGGSPDLPAVWLSPPCPRLQKQEKPAKTVCPIHKISQWLPTGLPSGFMYSLGSPEKQNE